MSAEFRSLNDLYVTPGAAVATASLPKVLVVVLNYNGRHHLQRCFESLRALDYPSERLEVLLVDNGSEDGSVEEMRTRFPWVRLIQNPRNYGFAPACNQGAANRRDAQVVAFLNNDMRVDPQWLRELVAPIVRGECSATTSKMLSWDGSRIDSAGGGMNFHGHGLQYGYGDVPAAEHDRARRTLFACGGAMAIDASVFESLGGFDREYFAYYEDVDLGWRAWLAGHEVHYVPTSICWHHHSSTSKRFPPETVRLIQTRNPLLTCLKNYDDANLRSVLPVALAVAVRRMLLVARIPDQHPYFIYGAKPVDLDPARAAVAPNPDISREAVADLIGIHEVLARWPHWMQRRREVQALRKRRDDELFGLFLKPLWSVEPDPVSSAMLDGLCSFYGLDRMFAGLDLLERAPQG